MRMFFKILKICIFIVIFLTLSLFSAAFLFQEKVADVVLNQLNKSLSTNIELGSFSFSFIRRFPQASLNLKDVTVFSSPNFDKKAFGSVAIDTLLTAKSISVEFKIPDILKHNYTVASVNITDGRVNLFSDRLGMVNYNVEMKGEGGKDTELILDLEKINLNRVYLSYLNLAIDLSLKANISNARLKSRISGDNIDFKAQARMQTDSFSFSGFSLPVPVITELETELQTSDISTHIKKGILVLDKYRFDITGAYQNEKYYDFRLNSKEKH